MKILFQLNSISKRYGQDEILSSVNFSVYDNHKIGMLGRNGAGKSTLCKIITGEENADSGTIDKSPDLRLSYLEQHNPFKPEETVKQFLLRYTRAEEWKCGKTAGKFQLKNEKYDTIPIGELSGGFQTRVKLAAMLVTEPNFLILDEPTNFLDLNTLLLLERFLQTYNEGFLIVSHDRQFLKKTCEQTVELENGKTTFFPGDIEEFLAIKTEQIEQKTRYNANIEQKQKHLQAFVERFRAKASKARQAQSKLKQMMKLDRIQIEHSSSSVNIRIPQVNIRRGFAFHADNLTIGYPEKCVADDISVQFDTGEHIAVLGANGQGKTTFLSTISGTLPPLNGGFTWSKHSQIGFYAQNVYSELDTDETVLDYLTRCADPAILPQEILNIAGSFLFRGDEILKSISILSGGERARVCLAGLLLSKKPVLILDEPTNHLDFETVEALGMALQKYNGTILFVSHDRTFVNMLASSIIDVADGKIVHFPGTYEDYIYHLEDGMNDTETDESPKKKKKQDSPAKNLYKLKKEINANIRKMEKQINSIESEHESLVKERLDIIHIFSEKPELYSIEKSNRLDQLSILIQKNEEKWVESQQNLEELKLNIPE